jgi:hypothetical protein
MGYRQQINKRDYIIIKSFSTAKEIINKISGEKKWEKIFVRHISNKELISKSNLLLKRQKEINKILK